MKISHLVGNPTATGIIASPKVWAIGAVSLATILTSIPYIYGAICADPIHQFTGVVAWHGDVFYYLAQMRQFRAALLIANPVTPEIHSPVLFNGLLAPLAWLGQVTHLPNHILYLHAVRVVSLGAVAAAVLALTATASFSQRARIVAVLLALFGSGWRWLVWVAPPDSLLSGLPFWRKVHEGSTLQQAMTVPHLALAGALVCLVLYFFLRGCRTGSRHNYIAAGATLAFLSSFHPFEVAPLWVTLGSLVGLLALRRELPANRVGPNEGALRKLDRVPLPNRSTVLEGMFWVVALPLPILAFFAITSRISSVVQNVGSQMSGGPTEFLFILVYYGPLLPLALLVPLHIGGNKDGPSVVRAVLFGWVILVLLLEAFPVVPMPSHFRVGLQLVCAILSAWLLVDAWPCGRIRQWMGLIATGLLLLLSVPSFTFYLTQLVGDIRLQAPTFYVTRDEQSALLWLEHQASANAVVLADSAAFNLYIAPYTGRRPFRGHNAMTIHIREKDDLLKRFFSPETIQETRHDLAVQSGITHAVVSEASAAVRQMMESNWLLASKHGKIDIYKIDGDAGR